MEIRPKDPRADINEVMNILKREEWGREDTVLFMIFTVFFRASRVLGLPFISSNEGKIALGRVFLFKMQKLSYFLHSGR